MRPGVLSYLIKIFLILVIVAGIFAIAWLRSSIYSLQYELGGLQEELRAELLERQRLLAQRAQLLSVKGLRLRAQGLGLGFPERSRVFYVKAVGGNMPQEASFKEGY
jgi:hypothetical protein